MKDNKRPPAHQEAYVHSYDGTATRQVFSGRTADKHAAFFLPHLTPGMHLLDCGSGPGTITAGLAHAVSPGEVTGIEIEAGQVELARENAAKLGLRNVRFEQGSAYELPYPDNQFDAVFSHAMLEHLRDPAVVVKEMRRVLKPGGIAGIRCADMRMSVLAPSDDILDRAWNVYLEYRRHCGGDPAFGRRSRWVLREGGFTETIGTASCETWATEQTTRSFLHCSTHANARAPPIAPAGERHRARHTNARHARPRIAAENIAGASWHSTARGVGGYTPAGPRACDSCRDARSRRASHAGPDSGLPPRPRSNVTASSARRCAPSPWPGWLSGVVRL